MSCEELVERRNMNTKQTFVEPRKHKRDLTEVCTYAVLRHPANTIGQIIDISLSGLAFNYLSSNSKPTESNSLDILAGEGLCLENIAYELIDDFIIPHELPFSKLIMHRQCVKFSGLTNDHVIQLQAFIKNHGITDTNIA